MTGVQTCALPILIPSVTVLPTSNSSAVTVYRDSLSSTVQCAALTESTINQTWATNLTNWIPPQYGAGYQVQLYAAPTGTANPQTAGVNLPVGGSGNSDSWYFDYSAGIVNFADTNVPSAVTWNPTTRTGNVVYVVGARYTGGTGISNIANITLGNISTINGLFWANGVNALAPTYGNTQVAAYLPVYTGNISANTANITTIITTGGLFWANGTSALAAQYGNANVSQYLPTYTGNLYPGNVSSTFYGNINTDYISSQNTSVVTITVPTALGLPTGGNTARPSSPRAGQFRYNSDITTVEFYNGVGWVPLSNVISGQIIVPDGVSTTYTLNYASTATGLLVSINGTVQRPGSAYSVTGTQITFAETPLVTDIIDIRFLAVSSTTQVDSTVVDSGNILVTTSNTIVDSFDATAYRSAKYIASSTSATDSQYAEIGLVQNAGISTVSVYNIINTGSNSVKFYSNTSGSTVYLLAQATASSNVRIQRTYFIV